ncbi:MAG: peptidoglycan-associated lipoprotein Pal [Ramlibacter sp.]
MNVRFQYHAIVVAAGLLAACSSTPPVAPAPQAPAPAAPAAPAAPQAQAKPAPARPDYLDPASNISRRRSVYFGFDDSTIRPQDREIIELQGRYLASHPDVSVRVEGNTDERGGSEYNLALGQRRAEAVAKALALMGAKASQLETTSWGKEKPVADGHDEAAWSQNRRAEIVYPAK